jgi:hypothetical protein
LIRQGLTGHIFETRSVNSLTRALRESVSMVENAEVRDRCREHVSRYTVREAARGIARAYEEATRLKESDRVVPIG